MSAQDFSYKPGRTDVNVGIGLVFPLLDDVYKVKVPMLQVTGDYSVSQNISLGALLGYSVLGYDNFFGDNINISLITIGGRGSVHFPLVIERMDAYIGGMLAYNAATSDGTSASGLGYGIFAGGRYSITEKFGVWGEFGYGWTLLNGGVTFRIR